MVLEMRLLLFSQFRVLRRWFKAKEGLNSGSSASSNLSLMWPSLPAPAEAGIEKGLSSASRADGTNSTPTILQGTWAKWWKGPLNWVTWVYLSMENVCELQSGGFSRLNYSTIWIILNFSNGSSLICLICNQAKLLLSKVLFLLRKNLETEPWLFHW